MSCAATSRLAVYQYGLMLSASTSMPCSSMARRRSSALDMRSASVSSALPMSAIAAGTAQCACTSTVFTRLPFTTTSRRRPWGAAPPPHETNAASAIALRLDPEKLHRRPSQHGRLVLVARARRAQDEIHRRRGPGIGEVGADHQLARADLGGQMPDALGGEHHRVVVHLPEVLRR